MLRRTLHLCVPIVTLACAGEPLPQGFEQRLDTRYGCEAVAFRATNSDESMDLSFRANVVDRELGAIAEFDVTSGDVFLEARTGRNLSDPCAHFILEPYLQWTRYRPTAGTAEVAVGESPLATLRLYGVVLEEENGRGETVTIDFFEIKDVRVWHSE